MASNPAEILAQGQALVPNAGEQMLRQQMGRLQIQGAQLQLQAHAQALHQAQTEFQRQQSFGHDMETFTTNPTPQGLASLFGRYPEFAKPIQDAHSALDEGRRKTDMTQIGSVAAMASRGDFEGAAKLMETRIAADRAAGQDTASDEAILEHFRSTDPAQQKIGTAMAAIGLGGAVGPEQAAAFLKANGLSDEPYTLSQGQVRYGSDNKPIASVAPKPDYLVIPEGGKAVPVGPGGPQTAGTIQGNPSAPTGGGDPASSGGAGNVSPHAAAVASTLASAGLPAPVVAGFMGNFHVEGGYDGAQGDGGSASGIAQWHSDRASTFQRIIGKPVTEATPAEQAQFVAWEMQNPQAAGMTVAQRDAILAAKTAPQAAALIDQYYERSSGKDRKTRMSAAAAFAGDTAPAQAAAGAQPGDPAGTLYGNPKPGAHVLTTAEATAKGLDPSKIYQQHPDGTVSTAGDAAADDTIPGDPNKTGPEYFASLPKGMQPTVRAIIDGRFPITAKMTSPNVIRLFEAANRVDPTVDASTYQRRVATQRDFASSGKSGQALTSARTIINHLYNIARESERIGGVGWTPVNSLSAIGGRPRRATQTFRATWRPSRRFRTSFPSSSAARRRQSTRSRRPARTFRPTRGRRRAASRSPRQSS
jgi:hypothetical protein